MKKIQIKLLVVFFILCFYHAQALAQPVNIIALDHEYDLIVIDKGYSEDINDGDYFYVTKDDINIGIIQVRKAKEDLAACDIISLSGESNLDLGTQVSIFKTDILPEYAVVSNPLEPLDYADKTEPEESEYVDKKSENSLILQEQMEQLKIKALEVAEEVAKEKEIMQVTFNFKDADIQDVLRIISRDKNINIIASENIKGKVTASFQNVDVYRALSAVLASLGYSYIKDDDIVRIVPLSEGEINTQYFIFKPNYSKVEEIKEVLSGMLSSKGRVLLDKTVNQMMVIDTSSNLERIKDFVKQLDIAPKQVMIKAKILDIRLTKEEDLGVDWRIQSSTGVAPDPRMDVGFFNETVEGGGRQGLSIFKFGTIGTSELEATISALKQDDKVNILSEPSVTTLNNKTALIKVVDKEAYREFTQETGETQDVTNYEWKEKETGISLEVTPHVTSNNMIMLKVIPSAKELKEYRSAPIPGTELIEEKAFPIITTREANAEVLISHGNTLVIGGLIKKSKRNTNVGVPVLSKIPVLGWAFKRKEEEIEESELMIFITPYIVNSGLNATKTN